MYDVSFEEESFLEIAIGNFFDCIKNTVYNLQKYIDRFYSQINSIYDISDTITDPNVKQVLNFFMIENENIIKLKGIGFASDVSRLITRKYVSLVENIKKESYRYTYKISKDAYNFLDKCQDEIDSRSLILNNYSKKEITIEEICKFTKFMETEFHKYDNMDFTITDEIIDHEQILEILDTAYVKLSFSMTELKKLTEDSMSVYTTANACRRIISLMIILYHILITIKIHEEL